MKKHELEFDPIKEIARSCGFELVGITKAEIPEVDKRNIQEWVNKKFYGGMEWFIRNTHIRNNFENLGFTPKSAIVLGCTYFTESYEKVFQNYKLKISRYAVGEDYHGVLKKKANPILEFLKINYPNNKFRMGVDSLPIAEKVLAKKSGIGWRGKNTIIINPEIGSYFFLAIILTNLEISYNAEEIPDRCGKCRLCLDACPTGALFEEYKIDASKCISYQTIEDRKIGDISSNNKNRKNWIFGCDICQEVCPWNKKKLNRIRMESREPKFQPSPIWEDSTELEIIEMDLEKFTRLQKKSPISRIQFEKWRENISIFLNSNT
ncbi:MAG: tRNA epoxyqueuosine(34) reductase QueG [Leptospiraceae bacterium]|nr:tRNA epoxyqueuosine(34) reductase QueG [Leptospiraceae bacterium]MCK6381089.1 tRNA epoxyqueuosine(34) reductase QueG [Leptospiraceae bacterium]NUM40546.1 tRNA epoxyqueuosine(34) reductase QueG [Leptospiraceae bacterium]